VAHPIVSEGTKY